MKLGAFSISLSVQDLAKSKAFYEDLGFSAMGGDTLIGLFRGMFEGNLLTFNPGGDQDAGPVDPFDDVRAIKAAVAEAGHPVEQEQGGDTGPASFLTRDPDGNVILIDQHR